MKAAPKALLDSTRLGPCRLVNVAWALRVEMWRGGSRFGLSVAAPFVWQCPSNLAVAPFPHPAHRTGHADLPHPALGQDITPSTTPGQHLQFQLAILRRMLGRLRARPANPLTQFLASAALGLVEGRIRSREQRVQGLVCAPGGIPPATMTGDAASPSTACQSSLQRHVGRVRRQLGRRFASLKSAASAGRTPRCRNAGSDQSPESTVAPTCRLLEHGIASSVSPQCYVRSVRAETSGLARHPGFRRDRRLPCDPFEI